MSVINTNYLALVSQNNLVKSQTALGTAIERLSSGLRINSAKDDAAGQAIANRFTANIKGLTQASRNANDGISIAQTTEGSLNEINNNLQRIRELSVQAANGSNSQSDLDSIQAEIKERLDEIDRVSRETQFNGKYVLGDDAASLSVQVGAHDNQRINIELSRIDSTTLNLGSFNVNGTSTGTLTTLDLNKAGAYDKTITGSTVAVDVQANSFQGAVNPPTGSGITAVTNGSGGIDVYALTSDPTRLAVEASDGKFYEITHNTATGQWFWDTSDTSSVVAKADLNDDPVLSTPVQSTDGSLDAAAGFINQNNVTLIGTNGGFNGDVSGIDISGLDPTAEVVGISFDASTSQYYAQVANSGVVAENGHYKISVDATGVATATLDAGDVEATGGATVMSTAIDYSGVDLTLAGFDTNAKISSIAYDASAGTYYAQVTDDATGGQTYNGYYEVSVDSATGAVTFTGTAADAGVDDNLGTTAPGTANAVTHTVTAATPAAVTIDFSAGLFARNDVNNADPANFDSSTGTMTQKYAAVDNSSGSDPFYYEVEATFTLNAGATQGSKNISDYTVSYTINVAAGIGGAKQVSESNVDTSAAIGSFTLSQDSAPLPNPDDLYNLEYTIEVDTTGSSSTGLYGINDADGNATGEYAVLGTDGRYYKAEVETDADGNFTGKVNWTTDTSSGDYEVIDASLIDAGTDVQDLTNEDVEVVAHGKYTGLAADQTLVSYQDSKGDTQYLIKTGTGDEATYVKAQLGDADSTGNIAVTAQQDADGEAIAVTLRSDNPLGALDSALQKVDDLRSHLGAIQNRFESTIANLTNTVANLSAARSRIEDADYAVEVSNMTRAQILQQAGTSVLAQANQVPQTVLSLLR